MLLNPGLASASSQVQYDTAGARVGPPGVTGERMNVRQFASEAYPRIARGGAWQDLLAQLRLRSAPFDGAFETFATASLRGDADSMMLGRLTAGSQTLAPSARRSRLPIGLLPLDQDLEVEAVSGSLWVPPGTLILLPCDHEWRIALDRVARIVALAFSDSVLKGRAVGWPPCTAPRRHQPEGFAGVFIKFVETAAAEMDALPATEWQAVEQGIADLFLTLLAGESAAAAAPSIVALFNRVTLAIERRLHDPDLTAGRIARAEGISERYLQKLFEQNGVSFGHYLRDRRLQRARAALIAPADSRAPVADVAYRCGFADAANFNRLFKERFGAPPARFAASTRASWPRAQAPSNAAGLSARWRIRSTSSAAPSARPPSWTRPIPVTGRMKRPIIGSPSVRRMSIGAISAARCGRFSRSVPGTVSKLKR